jgi:hypothetical protein
MSKDNFPIIFAGCSYTWGEGLELYQNDKKWIEARNSNMEHFDIKKVTDEKSAQFREDNRFAGIVSNHYNTTAIVAQENGGCEAASHRHIVDTRNGYLHGSPEKNANHNFAVIIYQFTALDRNPPHFTYFCKCNRCVETTFQSISNIWELITPITKYGKKLNNLLKEDEFNISFYHEMVRIIGLKNEDDIGIIHDKLIKYFIKWKTEGISKLVEELKEINKEIPIYFLDTWNSYEHGILNKFDFIKDRTIPLIDENGNSHTKWKDWSKNVKGYVISSDFPKTNNHHPSLKSHKLISSSIIKFLDEKNIKRKKDYI